MDSSNSEIAAFYNGKTIFLTGATGFVGKVLLAHLLAIAPNFRKIFLLVRPLKGVAASVRLEKDVLWAPFFKDMFARDPSLKEKLHAVEGDVGQEFAGLAPDTLALVQSETSIILHCAANVSFNNPIKEAISSNALGAVRMLNFARSCKNLLAHIHVSTCYVNSYQHIGPNQIEEKIYPFPVDHKVLLDRVMKMSKEESEKMTEELKKPWPNTYTMSKALGEVLLQEQKGDVPMAIVRPTMVGGAMSFPIPGWVEGLIGPTGVYVKTGLGQLHVFPAHHSNIPDIVPVDTVSAVIMAAAWKTAVEHGKIARWTKDKGLETASAAAPSPSPSSLKVYQVGTSTLNPTSRHQLRDHLVNHFTKHPAQQATDIPWQVNVSGILKYSLAYHTVHSLPAALSDLRNLLVSHSSAAQASAKEVPNKTQGALFPLFQKTQLLLKAVQTLQYFTDHQWFYSTRNMIDLLNDMGDTDKALFSSIDVSKLNWQAYVDTYCLGMKRFILREKPSAIPKAKL